MIDHFRHGKALLIQLELTMKTAGLWSEDRPSDSALASVQPFACDTLAFEQWLQFIFIPRVSVMLEAQRVVPPMSLLPMAEMSWQGEYQSTQLALRDFDQWSQSLHG